MPRRLQIVVSLTAILILCIVFLGNTSTDDYDPYLQKVPYGPKLEESVHHVVEGAQHVVDHIPNPLRTPAHKPPPEQANSSSGEAKWYSDWKWRNPFSSDVVYDEERAVLPPLRHRPPVYTYFDPAVRRKDEKSRKAERELLQIWRRAWWAQGFKPIVLSKSEAMYNPMYRRVQGLAFNKGFEHELMRWLAWSNMGTGILCNFMAVPMAPYNDPTLAFLRRGEYPELMRYDELGSGLFVGSKEHIDAAVKEAIESPAIKRVKYLDEALASDVIKTDSKSNGIAFYSDSVIKARYPEIKEKLDDLETVGDGLAMLPPLINSHLHSTWQSLFPKGIAVLKPLPEHTTALIEPAIDLARNLSQCSFTPLPSSCPPNRPKCKPCVSNNVPIFTFKVFRNESSLFTIGTVPHPLTMTSLVKQKDDIDVTFIRRDTDRDVWIRAATKELLGNGISSFDRLPSIKDAVASEYGRSRSLWLIAEQPLQGDNEKDREELNWHFGFKLPYDPLPDGKSETPVPGPERRPPPPKPEYGDGPIPSEAALERDNDLFEKAKKALKLGEKGGNKLAVQVKEVVEAWNLADTEAWKFIRAYNARRRVERRKWDDDEASFQGGKGVFDRWMDKIT